MSEINTNHSHWHLVRASTTRAMAHVATVLHQETDDVLCLYRWEMSWYGGKPTFHRVPLFQTPYLFAKWDGLDAEKWHVIRWTRGVAEIVGNAIPAIVPDVEIEAWRGIANEKGTVDQKTLLNMRFTAGEEVEFTYGAFESRQGEFCYFRGNSAAIKIALLGRNSIVYIPANLVSSMSGSDPAHSRRGASARRLTRRVYHA